MSIDERVLKILSGDRDVRVVLWHQMMRYHWSYPVTIAAGGFGEVLWGVQDFCLRRQPKNRDDISWTTVLCNAYRWWGWSFVRKNKHRLERQCMVAKEPEYIHEGFEQWEMAEDANQVMVEVLGKYPLQLEAFRLWLQGYTYEEIGQMRGVSRQAVGQQVLKCQVRMKEAAKRFE